MDSDYGLRKLIERGFVTSQGRADAVGRPLLFGTTPDFLERFGLNSLDDLPRPREIEELLKDPAFAQERALLIETQNELETDGSGGGSARLGESGGHAEPVEAHE